MSRLVQIANEWRSPGAELPWAVVLSTPLVAARAVDLPSFRTARPPRLVAWPGALARDDGEDGVPDPRTWGQAGWSALQDAIEDLLSRTLAPILVRPAAGHIISDTPSCLRLLQYIQECTTDAGCAGRLGMALDPGAMLTESMRPAAEDHVTRILQSVGREAGVACIVTGAAATPELCRRLAGPEMPLVTVAR